MSTRQASTLIEPAPAWRTVSLRELGEYRDLLFFLVWRDIKALYAQTILGIGWAVLRPVFSMIVFTLVFGKLARIPSDGLPYPLFAYAALLPWTYFSAAFTGASQSLISNTHLWSKVYFPRLIIPLTPVLGGLVDFAVAAVMLGVLMAWYGIAPAASAPLVLPLIVLMAATAAGIGFWLSALAVQYRDVRHANQFLSQLLMYAAPVIWPVSLIESVAPGHAHLIRSVYGLYPMAGVIEGFRAALFGLRPMPWDLIASGTASAAVILITGALYFRHSERLFADVA